MQVEIAQKRAPFSERKEKKRKRSEAPGDEITEPALAPSLPVVQPAPAKAQPVQPSSEQEAKADEKETAERKKVKTAGKAAKDAQGREAAAAAAKPEGKQEQKQKQKPKPKTMPPAACAKQLLVRTVALGNLSSATSAQAVAHAQQATQVSLCMLSLSHGAALVSVRRPAHLDCHRRYTSCLDTQLSQKQRLNCVQLVVRDSCVAREMLMWCRWRV